MMILVTGTPCVGKTSVARLLARELDASYIGLTGMAFHENLVLGEDVERGSAIVDEEGMRRRIGDIAEGAEKDNIVVDGHYAVNVVPEGIATRVFVLRRDPVELRKFMERCGFSGRKLWENLACEILDVCLSDALNVYEEAKVCELDVTGRSVEGVVTQILDILNGSGECRSGVVDWLGKLEDKGLLEEFLRL